MNDVINGIIEQYKNGEKSLEETNKALEAAGANFYLTDKGRSNWSAEEMAEGFHAGEPAKEVLKRPDMSRCTELAGKTVVQRTAAGDYYVTYDEMGYAVNAIRALH